MIALTHSLYRKVRKSFKCNGLAGTIWLCLFNVAYRVREWATFHRRANKEVGEFDRKYGVDTGGRISLSDLDIASQNADYGNSYDPIYPNVFRNLLEGLQIRYEDYLFVDFGSGKGRALLVASDFPFKRIIGVEFSPELHAIAVNNIRAYKNDAQRCKNLEAVCMDATVYQIPIERAVLYFFNPFKEKRLMAAVLENVSRSLKACPRELVILYCGCTPEFKDLLDHAGFLKQIKSGEQYVVYGNHASRTIGEFQ